MNGAVIATVSIAAVSLISMKMASCDAKAGHFLLDVHRSYDDNDDNDDPVALLPMDRTLEVILESPIANVGGYSCASYKANFPIEVE
jgi:hypothetical protein